MQIQVLISAEEIATRVGQLGKEISGDYAGDDLVVVGILRGAFVFVSELIRQITIPLEVDFMAVSSYGPSTKTSGVVRLLKDLDTAVEGRNLLIVEDIIDTGLTLSYLQQVLLSRNPASIKTAVLLDKVERRQIDFSPDYIGFTIPDRFVIGYGIDHNQRYRELPYVGVVPE
ncbi:MAG: hypoxanthine phosphoribosyltransferase [Firmicutes bacterium]|nr:hypoxanthine phosphoribosyltransferase [Bacillota bacterium]